ncbi:MAG: hypothetical protein J7647_03440 [Cyanobacteria bacterium SBLK]|nr:hypothetical protein [Cyanobacteria bacterium SBLK]
MMTIDRSHRVRARFATKIKKWLDAIKQLRNSDLGLALPVTRLTSIKSLCQDQKATRAFALYISQCVLQEMITSNVPENLDCPEWHVHQNFAISIVEAIAKEETPEVLQHYLTKIAEYKNIDRRRTHWTAIHFVQSGYLLKLEYALRCCTESDREIWAYKLAREYVERYSPAYGAGLIPDSIPFLLEIAEFWCQYYFDLSLHEKFSKAIAQIEGISLHECLTSYQSPVTSGALSLSKRHPSPVIHPSPVTGYQSPVTDRRLPIAGYPLSNPC